MRKTAITSLLALAVSATASHAVAACSRGQCTPGNGYPSGGDNVVYPNGGYPSGGYPAGSYPNGGDSAQPTYPTCPSKQVIETQATEPAVELPAAPEAEIDLGDSSETSVYVTHPINKRETLVRTLPSRAKAISFAKQLERRYWVTYQRTDGQAGVREARSAAQIDQLVAEITSAGNTVTNISRVETRVGDGDDFSLESTLAETSPAPPTNRPSTPVAPQPPTEQIVEKQVDENLAALEGIWSGVIRSGDGQPLKLELKLDSGGWAQISAPTARGDVRVTERQVSVENGELMMLEGSNKLSFGKLLTVEANRFVLASADGQITFLKQ